MSRVAIVVLMLMHLTIQGVAQTDPEESKAKNQLVKIDELKPPVYTESKDDFDYKKVWIAGYLRYLKKKNDLIWEFVKNFPDHARSRELMEEWFTNLGAGTTPTINSRIDDAVLEIDTLLVHQPPEWVTVMGSYYRAYYILCQVWNRLIFLDSVNAPPGDRERRNLVQTGMTIIDEFAKVYPKEIRAVRLFDILAEACHDPVSSRSIYARILADYPYHPNRALYEGKMRREDKLGEPFAFEFEDSLSGEPVNSNDYKGKVVLVVFWAHSVLDCRQQMLSVKKTWFRFQHEGFEVVDISLDTIGGSGKKAYNDFVSDNKMSWKHFFQGSGIDSEFSKSWGVNSLPTWFLVDRKGNLRYTDAFKDSETKIKELLKEKADG